MGGNFCRFRSTSLQQGQNQCPGSLEVSYSLSAFSYSQPEHKNIKSWKMFPSYKYFSSHWCGLSRSVSFGLFWSVWFEVHKKGIQKGKEVGNTEAKLFDNYYELGQGRKSNASFPFAVGKKNLNFTELIFFWWDEQQKFDELLVSGFWWRRPMRTDPVASISEVAPMSMFAAGLVTLVSKKE